MVAARFSVQPLTPEHAPHCLALSHAVGWVYPLETWERRIEWCSPGAFGMFEGERLLGTTLALRYGVERAWISMVITHPDYQGQGIGKRLMHAALEYLNRHNVRETMLDASVLGRPMYEKMGFRALGSVQRWRGTAAVQPGELLPCLSAAYLPEVIKLDRDVFGAARPRVITRLLQSFPDLAWAEVQHRKVQGFVLAQPEFAGNVHIGMWIHQTPHGADQLLRTALNAFADTQITLEVREDHRKAQAILRSYGFEPVSACTRMIYGSVIPKPGIPDWYYGVGSFAVG